MTIHKLCKILMMKVSRRDKTHIILSLQVFTNKSYRLVKNCKVVYRGSTSLLAGREYHHLTGFTATVNDRIKIHNPLSIVKEYRFPLAFSSTNFSKIGIFFFLFQITLIFLD